MIQINGKYNTATLYTDTADDATVAQVTMLMNQPSVEGSKVRIMPDCHAGAGCVIGTTMTITDKVIPNLVGVDIGCGMLATKLKEQRINLPKFDSISQAEVPAGMKTRQTAHSMADEIDVRELTCYKKPNCKVSEEVFRHSLGTINAVTHLDRVEIDLHDAFLRPEEFDEEREIRLKTFPDPRRLRPEEHILCRLLRDGTSPALAPAFGIFLC